MKRDEVKIGMRVLVRHNGVSRGTVVGEPRKGARKWTVRKDSTGREVRVIPEKMKALLVQAVGDPVRDDDGVLPAQAGSLNYGSEGPRVNEEDALAKENEPARPETEAEAIKRGWRPF